MVGFFLPLKRGPTAAAAEAAAAALRDKQQEDSEAQHALEKATNKMRMGFKPPSVVKKKKLDHPPQESTVEPSSADDQPIAGLRGANENKAGSEMPGATVIGAARSAIHLRQKAAKRKDAFDLDSSEESDSGAGSSARQTPKKQKSVTIPREMEFPPGGEFPKKLGTMSFDVVGCSFYKTIGQRVAGEQLYLVREPANKFDPNAIKVLMGTIQIGHVPKVLSEWMASLMDNGLISVTARISATTSPVARTIPAELDVSHNAPVAEIHAGAWSKLQNELRNYRPLQQAKPSMMQQSLTPQPMQKLPSALSVVGVKGPARKNGKKDHEMRAVAIRAELVSNCSNPLKHLPTTDWKLLLIRASARRDVLCMFQILEADKSSLYTLLTTDSSAPLHDDIECRNGAEFGRLLTAWREKSENQEDERRFREDIERLEDFTRENAEHHTAFMASLHRANATVLQLSASRERRASLQREIEAVQTALLDQTIACGFFLSLHSLVERFDNALDLTRAEAVNDDFVLPDICASRMDKIWNFLA